MCVLCCAGATCPVCAGLACPVSPYVPLNCVGVIDFVLLVELRCDRDL
jgi:hypothetical protein